MPTPRRSPTSPTMPAWRKPLQPAPPYGLDDALTFVDNTEVGPATLEPRALSQERGRGLRRDGASDAARRRALRARLLGRTAPFWGLGARHQPWLTHDDFALQTWARATSQRRRGSPTALRVGCSKCGFEYAGQGMGPSLFHRGMVPIDRFQLGSSSGRRSRTGGEDRRRGMTSVAETFRPRGADRATSQGRGVGNEV